MQAATSPPRTVVANDLRVAAHVKLGGHRQLVAAPRQHHGAQALAAQGGAGAGVRVWSADQRAPEKSALAS